MPESSSIMYSDLCTLIKTKTISPAADQGTLYLLQLESSCSTDWSCKQLHICKDLLNMSPIFACCHDSMNCSFWSSSLLVQIPACTTLVAMMICKVTVLTYLQQICSWVCGDLCLGNVWVKLVHKDFSSKRFGRSWNNQSAAAETSLILEKHRRILGKNH